MYAHYVALGDSITDNRTPYTSKWYHDWLNEWWQPQKTTILGTAGSMVALGHDSMAKRCQQIPADCDILTIYAGINDFGRNQALGHFGDKTVETFYGALEQLFMKCMSAHPDMAIYFISHVHIGTDFFPQKNNFGLLQLDYEEAICRMTQNFGIPHLSLYHNAGFNFFIPTLAEKYSYDTLHPNDLGHYKIAQKIHSYINS